MKKSGMIHDHGSIFHI